MTLSSFYTGQATRRFGLFLEKHASLLVFVAILAAVVWLPRLSNAFFVDEAGTFWLIEDGMVEGIRRALSKTGQSWLYTALLALWTSLFGTSEISLRLPSTLAALTTCALVIRIGRDRGATSSVLAGILLALSPQMTFAATIARPYAFVLLFSVLAISCLQSWARRGSLAGLYGGVAATLLAVYCHYTSIALLLPLLVILTENKARRDHSGSLFKALLLFIVGLSPAVLTLTQLSDREISAVAIIDELPGSAILGFHFFSTTILLVTALLLSLRITIFRQPSIAKAASLSHNCQVRGHFLPVQWSELRFGLALYLAPKLATLLAAFAVDPTLLVPRYSILSIVGEAYSASVLLATISSRFWMMCLGGVTIGSMLIPHFISAPPDTGWRPVIERSQEISTKDSCTFFALVGFAESKRVELLTREPTHSFILSPLVYYKLEPAVLLPASVSIPQEQDYMVRMVYPKISSVQCNLVLEWENVTPSPSVISGPQALARELSRRGCTKSTPFSAGLVTLTHWRCA